METELIMFRIIDELFQNLPRFVITFNQNRFGSLVLLALAVVACFGIRALHSRD